MTQAAPVQTLAVDNEGFLLYPEDWDQEVALRLADSIDIEMNDERWEVVNFVRDYFEANQTVPEARRALKAMTLAFGKEKATRKYLYQLFPYGYGQQACKIAGMRKPLKLMLDM
ncbi:TusE/DsrC/DsvC family sulfur relay protein [Leucothrix pacifica]|uniref:Sulfurtransferase n=1 Tax=Leucothrix pacifica TaxID=1247513 RepID=A0A317CMU1_9GAMM|nr:TusE/DsrC/DsvC family sulfur relay protein [Leucothrix pacifica]PWQ97630.1 sulfite reductase [Leucothrix pacifica]